MTRGKNIESWNEKQAEEKNEYGYILRFSGQILFVVLCRDLSSIGNIRV